jgi:peroxiredoxin Q/BCP
MLKLGSKSPSFSLPNQLGEIISLKDIKEDYIVLFFYPRDNTPGCTLEAQGFTALGKKFDSLSCLPLGVSGGDLKSKQKFCEKAKLDITLLSDEDGKIGEKFGSYGEKTFMGKKSIGFMRKTFIIGPERKIINIYDKVKPEQHPQEVLDFIKEFKRTK